MNKNTQELKLRIERYLFIIKTRYNIKREYLTLGVPISIVILFLSWALLTGHTLPLEGGNNTTGNSSAASKMNAYNSLVAQMNSQNKGDASNASTGENESEAGVLPEEKKSTKDDLDQMLVLAFIISTAPYTVDVFMQKKALKKKERAFSDFLYRLSELMRGGIDPIKAIIALSTGELGAVKKDIQECASLLVLGHSFEYSIKNLNESISSKLVSKYTNIIVQAAHTGGNVSDLIFRTSEDMRAVLSLEKEKEDNLKQYTLVFYLAQMIIIMLIYILSTSLLPLIQGTGATMLGGHGLSDINFKLGFFHMIVLNALLGGLIIGMITEGDMKQGLKHSNILIAISYIACVTVILPVPPAEVYNITVSSGGDQMVSVGHGGKYIGKPIVFNVTDLKGNPAQFVPVKMSINPAGTVNDQTTDTKGLVTVRPALGLQKGVYRIKATAGRSFNSTKITVQ